MPLLRETNWIQHPLLECIRNRLGSTEFQRHLPYLLQRVYEGEYGDTKILRRTGFETSRRENILFVRGSRPDERPRLLTPLIFAAKLCSTRLLEW